MFVACCQKLQHTRSIGQKWLGKTPFPDNFFFCNPVPENRSTWLCAPILILYEWLEEKLYLLIRSFRVFFTKKETYVGVWDPRDI